MLQILFTSVVAAAAVDCANIEAVAREGVAFSLLGVEENFTTPACHQKEKFKYFLPNDVVKDGDKPDLSQTLWFDPKSDKFTVESVVKEGERYLINVKFDLAKRSFNSKYYYEPVEFFQKKGACGVITHPEHNIYRADCRVR